MVFGALPWVAPRRLWWQGSTARWRVHGAHYQGSLALLIGPGTLQEMVTFGPAAVAAYVRWAAPKEIAIKEGVFLDLWQKPL